MAGYLVISEVGGEGLEVGGLILELEDEESVMGSVCVRSVMGSVWVTAPVLLASVVLTPVPVASVVLASKVVVGSVPLPTAASPS